MTLNFSHRSDDNFSSSMRFDDRLIMDGIQDKSQRFNFDFDFDDIYDYGRDRIDRGGSCEPNDILDLLPVDPFGMNMGATFTAWFDILEMDALNFIWNNAMRFPSEPRNLWMNESFNQEVEFDVWLKEKELAEPPSNVLCSTTGIINPTKEISEVAGSCSRRCGGDPHEALIYVLGYLGVPELLSVERVCKSLHSAVQSDPLLWRNIYIDQPLNERIDNDALLWITSRAQGNLQCLSLVKCSRVTDDGLKCVFESNPRLEKLCVPECTKLSIEGIVNILKEVQSFGTLSLKHLRIGGRYDVTKGHFEELKFLLGIDVHDQPKARKPRIYHGGHSSLPYDEEDDRIIDIDVCPKCENLRLVYDCPVDSCQVEQTSHTCRACRICVARCVQCGRCVNDGEYVETFCLDKLCLYCCEQQPEMMGALFKPSIVEQETEYHHVCG